MELNACLEDMTENALLNKGQCQQNKKTFSNFQGHYHAVYGILYFLNRKMSRCISILKCPLSTIAFLYIHFGFTVQKLLDINMYITTVKCFQNILF